MYNATLFGWLRNDAHSYVCFDVCFSSPDLGPCFYLVVYSSSLQNTKNTSDAV